MRSARWECALVACAIAACQVDATSTVKVDASISVQRSELSGGDCRPILTKRCEATNCGHRCNNDMQIPPGHLVHTFDCKESGPTSCKATYTTCDPNTGIEDPPPPPVSWDCANDHCGIPKPPITCVAAPCGYDCDANVRAMVPDGWRVTAATCVPSAPGTCFEQITACNPDSDLPLPLSAGMSCPVLCGETTTPNPCVTTCGHSCGTDAAAQVPPGERIVSRGACTLTPSGHPTECTLLIETCDANGNHHPYTSHYDDPCCGDPCCGDPCCGDECCGDPCCGDECCGDPCCGDECCGDPCCESGYGCWEGLSKGSTPSATSSPMAMKPPFRGR
jgi:hypothetical protein